MKIRTLIARLTDLRRRRWRIAPQEVDAPQSAHGSERRTADCRTSPTQGAARRLAEQIELAVEKRRWERADRLARAGARLMHASPRLTEAIARLRLAQGSAETALAIVDSPSAQSTSLRMLRAVCLIELGRVAEAHLDLRQWSRRSTAPMEARRLLALLESGHGAGRSSMSVRDDAVAALLRNLRQLEDPRTLELLVVDAVAESRPEQAEYWSKRLLVASRWAEESAGGVEPPVLLDTLNLDWAKIDRATPAATPAQIETLAMEMMATPGIEQVLSSVIRALEHSPDVRTIELLLEAGKRALDSMTNQASMCESLARLSLLANRREDAAAWARRGVEINPMSASLVRLAHELIDPGDPVKPNMSEAAAPERRRAA